MSEGLAVYFIHNMIEKDEVSGCKDKLVEKNLFQSYYSMIGWTSCNVRQGIAVIEVEKRSDEKCPKHAKCSCSSPVVLLIFINFKD